MKNTVQISIPSPCHENWFDMTVADQGRFCSSCQKNVIDFTNISDREINKIINKNSNLCGRFNANQLNRDIIEPKEKSSLWIAASTAIISFFSIGNQVVLAQSEVKIEQTPTQLRTYGTESNAANERLITGMVSNENGVLYGVLVVVQGTKTSTPTDAAGKYTIKAKTGDILVFSFVGMESSQLKITKTNNSFNVNLLNAIADLQGEMIVVKKRNFFSRIYQKISNWFR